MWCLAVAAVLFWMKSTMFLRLCWVELAVGSAGSLFASSVCTEGVGARLLLALATWACCLLFPGALLC